MKKIILFITLVMINITSFCFAGELGDLLKQQGYEPFFKANNPNMEYYYNSKYIQTGYGFVLFFDDYNKKEHDRHPIIRYATANVLENSNKVVLTYCEYDYGCRIKHYLGDETYNKEEILKLINSGRPLICNLNNFTSRLIFISWFSEDSEWNREAKKLDEIALTLEWY